jgi:glycosyltransferase involved in cell wall biosynthesis
VFARVRSAGAAHVLSVHAGDVYLLSRAPFGRAVARHVASRSDGILADGSHVRETLDDLLGAASGAIVQPMGVGLDQFGLGLEAPVDRSSLGDDLVFVGRLVEKKGLAYLLRALPRVLERRPRAHLVVVGDGPLLPELREEAGRLQLQAAVSFLGRRSQREVAEHLRRCRIAVVPSIVDRNGETDGMPTVVVEAMAAGARVVATAVDGIPDLVRHRENGWLCSQRDEAALATAILEALEEPDAGLILSEARATAEAHSWPNVAARYLAAFRRAAGSAGVTGARRGPRTGSSDRAFTAGDR